MKSHLVALASLVVCATLAHGQAHLEWVATRDGTANLHDYGWACATDASGAVYMLGDSNAPSPFGLPGSQIDMMLTKFSATGALVWSKRYDMFGYNDTLRDVALSPSGDLYVTGSSFDGDWAVNGTIRHLVLAKYSTGGVQQWVRRYHVQGINDGAGIALAFDASGNVIVAGKRNFATQLLSYAPDGTLLWEQHIGGGGLGGSTLIDVVVTPQNEILACGTRAGDGHQNLAVYKYLADGTYVWTAVPDLASNYQGNALTLALAGPGKVIVGGSRYVYPNGDAALALLDVASGTFDWTYYYDGGFGNDEVNALATDASGVLWAVLRSTSAAQDFDWLTLRLSPAGQILSSATWNGPSNQDDYPRSILLGSAGQAWVTGTTGAFPRDVAVVQYDSTGAYNWERVVGIVANSDDLATGSALAPNDRIVVTGSTNGGSNGTYDYLAVQLDVGDSPSGYCTPKVNSLGCTPRITFAGQASLASASGFNVVCDNVLNQKSGLLFYGVNGAASSPFNGGYLCVASPTHRTPVASSNGSSSGNDCSGSFALDLNAFATGALGGTPAPELAIAGTDVFCQQWSRDPGAQANSGLSSGLRYTVLP